MSVKTYGRTELIGGASGALDEYDADNLNEGDRCLTVLSTGKYHIHRLKATSGAAESSPDVIKPDSGGGVSPYTGTKRWLEIETGAITDKAVTLAKMNDMATASLLGRNTAATGVPEVLSKATAQSLLNVEDNADVTDAVNIGSSIHGVANKATPINTDKVPLIDTANGNVLKTSTWTNIKAFLKTYFDTLYAALAHKTRHENDGADEISVAGLSGLLADDQHVLDAEVLAVALSKTGLLMTTETELTIATGAITVTQARHKVDTEADAASDDLVTINGGATVNMIILRAEADARTIVIKHGTGNIWLQGKADISLDDLEDGILLIWDSTNSKWFNIGGIGFAAKGANADITSMTALTQITGPMRIGVSGAGSMCPLEIVFSDAGLAITSTSVAANREAYVCGFLKTDAGGYMKAGAMAFRVADGNITDGFASWNVHTTAYTGGVIADYIDLTIWAKHGAAFFENSGAAGNAPGYHVLKIKGVGKIISAGTDDLGSTPRSLISLLSVAGAKGLYLGYDTAEQLGVIYSYGANSGIAFWSCNAAGWAERMRIHTNGNVGIGTAVPGNPLAVNRSADGIIVDFESADAVEGDIAIAGNTTSYNAFVGSHYTQLKDGQKELPLGAVVISTGEIVSCEANIPEIEETKTEIVPEEAFEIVDVEIDIIKEIEIDGKIQKVKTKIGEEFREYRVVDGKVEKIMKPIYAKTAIQKTQLKTNHALDSRTGKIIKTETIKKIVSRDVSKKEYFPYIDTTNIVGDKRVYGVWFSKKSDDSKGASFGQDSKPVYLIAQVGLFKIRVTDTNGNIEIGDYLETSTRPMESQKQTSAQKENGTIAKAMVDVDWSKEQVDIKLGYKWKLIPCIF